MRWVVTTSIFRYDFILRIAAQLSVFSLHRRDGQHFFQPIHYWTVFIRSSEGYTTFIAHEVHRWLRCEFWLLCLPINDLILGTQGVGLVGLGSFAFHATLLYQAQLADELPMIYVGSMCLWLLYDVQPGFCLDSTRTRVLIAMLAAFDVLFSLT